MDFFEQKIKETINEYKMLSCDERVIVGLSGGADSVSLIYSLSKLNFNIVAVHINHMIRGKEAMRDQEFVSNLCNSLSIPLVIYTKDVPSIAKIKGISEELAGRCVRYECFEDAMNKYNASKIAVAHNMNDSIETMLFNMARGTGMAGLCGIPPVNGNIIRPLINTERFEIEAYLMNNHIDFVKDSTNQENIYSRNIIRNMILPHFEKINSSYVKNARRCADIIREENSFLQKLTEKYIDKNCKKEDGRIVIRLKSDEDLVIIRRVIIACLNEFIDSSLQISEKNISDIINLNTGKKFIFGDNISVKREYDKLIIESTYEDIETFEYDVSLYQPVIIRETKEEITFELLNSDTKIDFGENNTSYIDFDKIGKLTVRNRRVGDAFIPYGMKKSKKIKDFFIDEKIPPSKRDSVPILCSDGKITAIIGIRTDDNFKIDKHTVNILKITRRTKNAY